MQGTRTRQVDRGSDTEVHADAQGSISRRIEDPGKSIESWISVSGKDKKEVRAITKFEWITGWDDSVGSFSLSPQHL